MTEEVFKAPEGAFLLCVSDEAFEKLLARAKEFAEEHFRRYLFDHEGMNPQAIAVIREPVLEMLTEQYVEYVAQHAHWEVRESDKRRARKAAATRRLNKQNPRA